jgi:uridine kinase
MTRPYLVGITGGSASGKTRFIKELGALFHQEEVCILSQDNYYKPATNHVRDENGHINFDLPECIDLDAFYADIITLGRGEIVKRREYRFQHEQQLGDWMVFNPAPIIIVEGLFIFYRQDIFNLFDLKIFIDAQDEIKLNRRMSRDTAERNITAEFVLYQWENHVMPAYRQYLLPYKEKADLIINNNSHFQNSLRVVEDHFKVWLEKT